MNRTSPVKLDDCGLVKAAEILGDKWVLTILREVFYGVVRFDDIRNEIAIPRAILADRLKKLVEFQILRKRAYQEPGSRKRFAYQLDVAGMELVKVMLATMEWGDRFLRNQPSKAVFVDQHTGEPVEIKLVNQAGAELSLADLQVKLN